MPLQCPHIQLLDKYMTSIDIVLPLCCQARYPQSSRIPRAMWRGSNTDRVHDPMDESNVFDVARTRLYLMSKWYPQWIDANYTRYAQQAFDTSCVETLMPPGGWQQADQL